MFLDLVGITFLVVLVFGFSRLRLTWFQSTPHPIEPRIFSIEELELMERVNAWYRDGEIERMQKRGL